MSPRRSKPKFYLDENFPAQIGKFLQLKGYSIQYPQLKYRGIDDVPQLQQASKLKAVFLTTDKDFRKPDFPARRIKESAGVVIFRTDDPKKQYKRMAAKLLKVLEKNRFDGKLCEISIDLVLIKEIIE